MQSHDVKLFFLRAEQFVLRTPPQLVVHQPWKKTLLLMSLLPQKGILPEAENTVSAGSMCDEDADGKGKTEVYTHLWLFRFLPLGH